MSIRIPIQKVKCNVCHEEFQSLQDLVEHFNQEHSETSVIEEFATNSDTEGV